MTLEEYRQWSRSVGAPVDTSARGNAPTTMTQEEYYQWWRTTRHAAVEALAKSKMSGRPEPKATHVEKASEEST
eukprot:5021521-Lingulodinium_polyedra.AAC.1